MEHERASALPRLRVDASPALGPTPAAGLPAEQALRQIDRVEINSFFDCQGVTYYVLEVILDTARTKPVRALPTRLVGTTSHVLGNCARSVEVTRRFRDFEALRRRLSVCFDNLHPGCCAYCDAFIGFLSRSATQPGRFTKLTKRGARQRQALLVTFNKTIQLALQRHGEREADSALGPCEGRAIIPQVVSCFLRAA